mmetsp:Transcript_113097/g.243654  ORF Transcript_113097/g.243654 Transcript_113097/m.243654 type:complete len:83 (+) Transcript_113097:674-922(+)|eukprot:CAMPEP_0116894894 /NCGR_PEP_ID=MMETSP0467-20121206/4552_1 /TAXON_ID=283647 /ORGANISM="Mesodinium pulex, Strain SPMC105" /LENGTH=82 /DNA_ID=CAMNT_0004565349 /DNA_START=640 /DNA_END=888 /DNA_ORIENTATION=+
MDSGCVFMNIGRGSTVNEDDILESLDSGKLRGAWLDVTYKEPLEANSLLWNRNDVLLTQHKADDCYDVYQNCAIKFNQVFKD